MYVWSFHMGTTTRHLVLPFLFAHISQSVDICFLMTTHLCAKAHSFATLFALVTFKANSLFLVNPHMRVSILFVLIFVWASIASIPSFQMALKVSVQVTLVLKATRTSMALAHVI